MRDYRVTKGWIHIGTNNMQYSEKENKGKRIKREQKFNNVIRALNEDRPEFDIQTGKTFATSLKKEGDAAANAKEARKANLVDAYNEKKLKSKSLIKEAKGYIKKNNQKRKQKAS